MSESQEYLDQEEYAKTFPQANARILFNVKYGKIEDLIVEDFSNPDEKQILYKKYNLDFGNCLIDWKDWNLSDVLIKIFVYYEVHYAVRKKILLELSKVEEWKPHLSYWICNSSVISLRHRPIA
jgi:hypothetical protein